MSYVPGTEQEETEHVNRRIVEYNMAEPDEGVWAGGNSKHWEQHGKKHYEKKQHSQ